MCVFVFCEILCGLLGFCSRSVTAMFAGYIFVKHPLEFMCLGANEAHFSDMTMDVISTDREGAREV